MLNEFVEKPDKMEEACGVFGIYAPGTDVALMTYYGLYALQHRGQESAGIAVAEGGGMKLHKEMGLVSEVFTEDILNKLKGTAAIGHVRYSTTGSSLAVNAQPLVCNYLQGSLAVAHNGNLTNAGELREKLAANGSVFQSSIDSEVIVSLIARYGQSPVEEALMKCMIDLKGSYSLIVMTEDKVIGVRDPFGNRPLCLGKLGKHYCLASESCALDTIGAEFVRDVAPGEIITLDKGGMHSRKFFAPHDPAVCIFEYIYFARPDSTIDGINVMQARRAMGRELAIEHPVEADLVMPVPDSGIAGALGYAEKLGLVYDTALMKNRYIGRTFIQPEQNGRDIGVSLKLNPISKIIEGKKVVVVDDSIVRGTTSRKIVELIRRRGAKEVHMLVSSPPVMHPCYYGIDISERGQLIAAQKSIEEVRAHIGADSLHYLSLEGLYRALGKTAGFCTACLCGKYPIQLPPVDQSGKHVLEGKKEGRACGAIC
ncbi:MAG: amidophosphoribosyltransferase [Clostridia bacterium]|jgi:amidophosphoribosyltransferase|nr:amidophosphoribosyltransferase [Clostridia bacterium]